ncbi:hypothetical protein [Helicobacter pylori]|uniref:hypothetical protein n=1 Tax=Helicobacter pylori TaxID=210 RepID=UPI000EB114CF|nr:hypothetical protein [Helicobacter pylori]
MGFQNENKLKLGASVKATINNKVVEAKVISIGFNRVTLRSQKGNEATYVFNSDKFLKWFNKVPLTEHMRLHAENKKADILDGIKVVTSGPSVKERTSTPREPKESKFKLDFDFAEKYDGSFLTMAELYSNEKRSLRLGVLFAPMSYNGTGFQASLIILHALSYMAELRHHTDAEWRAMIDNRDEEKCEIETLDHLDRVGTTLFCGVIKEYAEGNKEFEKELNDFSPDGFWAMTLPKNKNEALFIAQLLCDGGINKYDLTCGGLTANLLADNLWSYGLRDEDYDDEGNVIENEAEGENLEN